MYAFCSFCFAFSCRHWLWSWDGLRLFDRINGDISRTFCRLYQLFLFMPQLLSLNLLKLVSSCWIWFKILRLFKQELSTMMFYSFNYFKICCFYLHLVLILQFLMWYSLAFSKSLFIMAISQDFKLISSSFY